MFLLACLISVSSRFSSPLQYLQVVGGVREDQRYSDFFREGWEEVCLLFLKVLCMYSF